MTYRASAIATVVSCVTAVLGFGESLQAQRVNVYRGDYTLGGTTGEATFEYRLDGRDTVRVGDYAFGASDAAALFESGDRYTEVRGRFEEGLPVGAWSFDFGDFRAADVAEARDLRYYLTVNGVRHLTNGGFAAGLPEGEWRTVSASVSRSVEVDTAFTSRVTFAAGVPQQSFELTGDGRSLLGLVSRTGFAEDTWELYDARGDTREWRFSGGRLLSVGAPGAAVPVLRDYDGDTLHVALDADYLRFLRTWQLLQGRPGASVSDAVPVLLGQYAAITEDLAATVTALGVERFSPFVRVVVPSVPSTIQQITALERLGTALERFEKEAYALLDDPTLRRVARTDDEAAYLRAAAAALYDVVGASARDLDTAYQTNVLRSVPLADYLLLVYPEGVVDGELSVEYDGPAGTQRRAYAGPEARVFDVAAGGLPEVVASVEYARAAIADLRVRLSPKLMIAGAPETSIVSGAGQPETIYARIDSLLGAQPRKLSRELGLADVGRLADQRMTTHRRLSELDQQREADELTACLLNLYSLAVTLHNLPTRSARVEDAYTDEVWNNIIATVMTERVKKRITEAYRERLVPYYLERVRTELSCDNAAAIDTELTTLYERVLALRDVDTETLEDDLKGERDPQRLLALLAIPPFK